jgi:membrane protein
VGIGSALWSASGYVGAFGRAMNRIYEIDEGRPVWKLRPQQLLLTVAALALAAVVALLLAISGPVARAIGDVVGWGDAAVAAWNVVRWPVILAAVVTVVAILYYATPNVRQPKFRWISVGAALAIVVWVLASLGFAAYVGNFASYDKTYGALGGVIVFLLWLWLTNLALLFGAELDAELERGRQLQAGIPAEHDLQLPPRDTRVIEKNEKAERSDVRRGRRLRRTRGRDA